MELRTRIIVRPGSESDSENRMKKRIYLDHAATTPGPRRCAGRDATVLRRDRATIRARCTPKGGGRAPAWMRARDRVAAALGVGRKEITFVGSGSEADNQAILGAARAHRARGAHVVSTQIEHHAVLHALDALARRRL